MRSKVFKAAAGMALLALPMQARADSPSLAAYVSSTSFFSPGATFDVQFLYGIQIQNSSLWYNVGGGTTYTQILKTEGLFPAETVSPAAGTRFNGLAGGTAGDLITFALCNGGGFANGATTTDITTTCSAPPGVFYSGAGSTNVAVTDRATWNGIRTVPGGNPPTSVCPVLGYGCAADADMAAVFGFEDRVLAVADGDFSDIVFATTAAPTLTPEPSTVLLMSAGLLGLVGAARRRKNQA